MTIIERWKEVRWIPPYYGLDRHLEHVCGGGFVVLILISFGLSWLDAAVISTVIFLAVELVTGIIRKNWKDCAFDFVQYQFHWPFFFAAIGNGYFFVASLALLLLLYFRLLVKGW